MPSRRGSKASGSEPGRPGAYTIRRARLTDAHFLRTMVAEAAGEDSPSAAAFVEQWGRAGDSGVVADSEFEPVGAAWYRVFEESDPAAGFVGGVTPELVLAVDAEHRRRGVGTAMLRELLRNAAEDGHASMGLTVPTFNTAAVALFTQHGFSTVREAGGLLTMQAKLGS